MKVMKKLAVILLAVTVVVLNLILSGVNVILGILLIALGLLVALLLDMNHRQSKEHTTTITRAARQSRAQRGADIVSVA